MPGKPARKDVFWTDFDPFMVGALPVRTPWLSLAIAISGLVVSALFVVTGLVLLASGLSVGSGILVVGVIIAPLSIWGIAVAARYRREVLRIRREHETDVV